jgi:hypothetical protein
MPREQRGLRAQQVIEQMHAQCLRALVGGPGQRVLRDEARHAAQREQADDGHRDHPHRDAAADEATIEQRLHQRRQRGLGQRGHQRRQGCHDDAGAALAEIRQDAGRALQSGHGVGTFEAGAALQSQRPTIIERRLPTIPPGGRLRAAEPVSSKRIHNTSW